MISREDVLTALTRVIDPELGIDVVNLGLVYDVDLDAVAGAVRIEMTLTSPGCPLGETISAGAESVLLQLPGVTRAKVAFVWSPPWHPGLMTPVAKAKLGFA